jgi:hypothetical protein
MVNSIGNANSEPFFMQFIRRLMLSLCTGPKFLDLRRSFSMVTDFRFFCGQVLFDVEFQLCLTVRAHQFLPLSWHSFAVAAGAALLSSDRQEENSALRCDRIGQETAARKRRERDLSPAN